MTLNKNYKDLFARAARTFVTSFAAVFLLGTVGLPASLLVGLLTALVGLLMNLFNVAPETILGRAGNTALQTFLATWAVTGYELSTGVLVAALAAAFNAFVNFVRETA